VGTWAALRRRLRSRLRTIRNGLLALVCTALLPALGLGVLASYEHYTTARDAELRASADVARAAGGAFASFVRDLARAQLALGISIAEHGHTLGQIQAELEAVFAEFGTLRALSWSSVDGRIDASTEPRLLQSSVWARDYFQDIVRGAPWALSPLLHSLADGAPAFAVARPIRGGGGEVRGVVIALVDPDRLEAILGSRAGGGVTAIVDPGGVLVARQPRLPEMSWDVRRRPSEHPLTRAATSGQVVTGIFDSPFGQARRIGAMVPIEGLVGWAAVSSRPYGEAMAPVWRGVAVRTATWLAFAAAGLLAALALSRRIARPLQALEAHASGLARGERSVALLRGPAEVERVAHALNDMSEALAVRREEAEAAFRHLALSEERFRLLAEHARDMVYRVRVAPPGPAFEYVSPAAQRIVGHSPEEHYADPRLVLETVHPDDRPALESLLAGEEVPEPLLLRWVHRDGRVVWTEHQVATLRDDAGAVVAVEAIARDVSDRMEAEEELRLARAVAEDAVDAAVRYGAEVDAIFATAPVGLLHLEGPGRVPRMNAAAREILGLDAGDASPLPELLRALRVVHPQRGPLGLDALPVVRALAGETTHGELLRLEPPPGSPRRARWLSVSAAPVRDHAGAVRGAVASFVDVTAMRELQEERETLMQMVSHDLRTPLHVIVGHGQLLRRGAPDAQVVARRADAILTSASRMQRLIQDMVDAARLEAGHLRLEREPVDLAAFLRSWRDRLAGALPIDRVRVEVPREVPYVVADPARLEQIVGNLVTNALKYSVADSLVDVGLLHRGDQLELSVRDRGPGIAPEDLPHLFDRYYRARGATRAEGLGLGLFITRKLVDAHGWRIDVASEAGRGSVFTVVIPAARAAPRGSSVAV
jgi:PAS domain S-box-containing protein